MTLFGIQLRKPSFNEITAATVMAVGIWVAVIGLAKATGQALQASDAGAARVKYRTSASVRIFMRVVPRRWKAAG